MLVPPAPTVAATLATAATLTRLPHLPATTAFATRMLELRQDLSTNFASNDLSCFDYIASLSCDDAYISCIDGVESQFYGPDTTATNNAGYSKLDSGISSCYCNYGVQYLSCYYSALGNKACTSYFGTYDWTSYESYWFQDNCGTVPPTLFGGAGGGAGKTTRDTTPPSVVSLDLQSVHVVTASTQPPLLALTYSPRFQSTGSLLQDECASTQFTLIEDSSTVYWAAYIGCASNQPQCCPWTASSEFFPATVTKDTTVTVTATGTPGATGTNVALNAFPQPANRDQGVLKACASDYYSISGQCCPSNYWPFTRDLGGQTPCYSSLPAVTEAPTLTAGLVGEPTNTQKPTSAVVNVVWAMSYPVASKGGLSAGAIAGIAVAAVVVVAALAVLSFFLFRARRKNKQLQTQAQAQAQTQQVPAGQLAPPQAVAPEGGVVAGAAAVPLAYDADKPQGVAQVPPAGGYVYPQQQYPQQQYPQQQYAQPGFPQQGYAQAGYVQPGYADPRASLAPSSATPTSQLVSQTTGTTNVSELSTQALVGGGGGGAPSPAPIVEADESAAAAYHQQLQQQQQQQYHQQYYQAPGQVPGQPPIAPQPGYVAVAGQPVYGQPQSQQQPPQASVYEAGDGQPAPVGPVEVASPDTSGGVLLPTASTAQPPHPVHPDGHPS
ncbi:uncharacterized protein SPSK_06063 [Sporothrix schenckii 1099-18]|uniref:Uncharacterized protein n=1 Tax=Sporothrix schenckii 1099-18 TaxID=1397361 RepID=A0A0F2MJ27_SPOSC|nr:uncharacterized protein SPSK_06063 [Sporothrix schenckii 1099-18]KJR89622.1 hypothetical protein SPSK_06063 [Sporothrix schenckii 1099-18]